MSAKKKPAPPVPQNWTEANLLLAEYGEKSGELVKIEADMNAAIATAREPFDSLAEPIQTRLEGIVDGLKIWATANRKTLTEGGKRKSVDMAAGRIGWYTCPPSIAFKRGLKIEQIVKNILELAKRLFDSRTKQGREDARIVRGFIRPKFEPNKEAMLGQKDLASLVEGVMVVTDVEEFYVDPTQAELVGAKS